jgi:cell division protein ZapA
MHRFAERIKMDESEFSIQLKILDKHFTYTCKRKDEQNVRKAATNVTNRYMAYRSYYASTRYSMTDCLRLTALQFSLELLEDVQREDMQPFVDKIEQLNAELEAYLQAQ